MRFYNQNVISAAVGLISILLCTNQLILADNLAQAIGGDQGAGNSNAASIASPAAPQQDGVQLSQPPQIVSTTSKPLMGKVKEIFKESKDILSGGTGKQDEKKAQAAAAASAGGASASSGGSSSILPPVLNNSTLMIPPSANHQPMNNNQLGSIMKGEPQSASNFAPQGNKESKRVIEGHGPIDKITRVLTKGREAVSAQVKSIEEKASDIGTKVSKSFDNSIKKPISMVEGSGKLFPEGQISARAQAFENMRGSERDKYLTMLKRKQEMENPKAPGTVRDIVAEAKERGIIPLNEDRSTFRDPIDNEKSLAVEVFDKVHEIAKMPVESVMKPIDKVLGYEKDPLLRLYDNGHDLMRAPLSFISRPFESIFTGAFKTAEESKKDNDKYLSTLSDQERLEAKAEEEKDKKNNRSIAGNIADKTMDLVTKPLEIMMKPIDHLFGLDKNGKRNPFLKAIDMIYGLSKKPVDVVAKPFESILKKMADDGEELYQVTLHIESPEGSSNQGQQGDQEAKQGQGKKKPQDSNPLIITHIADGSLNIADRVLTKPLEFVMKPLNYVMGFNDPGKRNPILSAAHSLKNATRIGVELWTRPVDHIIKEISDLGGKKTESELQIEMEKQRMEASRIVRHLDKLHSFAQAPFEIVLRPFDRLFKINKDGNKKEPLLRAWDVMYQVVRAPVQIISRPIEDSILGVPKRRKEKHTIIGNKSQSELDGSLSFKTQKKNIFVDGFKKMEKMVSVPFSVISSPIRKLILGEDGAKMGTAEDKLNREVQAKAMVNGSASNVQINVGGDSDKITSTIDKMNNILWKPFEMVTQPISDLISGDQEKKNDEKDKSNNGNPPQQESPQPVQANRPPPQQGSNQRR